MSRIRSKDTEPEMMVRQFLHKHGFRFRLHVKDLAGKPDIVLPRHKTVIFVNGCFWHKHDCKRFVWPSSNADYWKAKINRNVERDLINIASLISLGWKVIVVWECELKSSNKQKRLDELCSEIKQIRHLL